MKEKKSKFDEEFERDYDGFVEGIERIRNKVKTLTRGKKRKHGLPMKNYRFTGSIIRW